MPAKINVDVPGWYELYHSLPAPLCQDMELYPDRHWGNERRTAAEALWEAYHGEIACCLNYCLRAEAERQAASQSASEYRVSMMAAFAGYDRELKDKHGQFVCHFNVLDLGLPKEPARLNFHGMQMQQSIYAGGIAVNWRRSEEDGHFEVFVSTHH